METPVADDQGNTYYSPTNARWLWQAWKTLDIMIYQHIVVKTLDFVIAWEGCMKYYEGYNGYPGDLILHIDNIALVESSRRMSPPSTPGTISGNGLPKRQESNWSNIFYSLRQLE